MDNQTTNQDQFNETINNLMKQINEMLHTINNKCGNKAINIQHGGNNTDSKTLIDYAMYGIIALLFIGGIYICFKNNQMF